MEIIESLTGSAGAMVLLALVLYGLYKLSSRFAERFVAAIERIAADQQGLAGGMERMAVTMAEISESVKQLSERLDSHVAEDDVRSEELDRKLEKLQSGNGLGVR